MRSDTKIWRSLSDSSIQKSKYVPGFGLCLEKSKYVSGFGFCLVV